MSFWTEKIQEILPPPAPEPRAVAPAAWWQQGTEHAQPRQAVAVPQQPQQAYYPAEADHVSSAETCPRCGSREYAEFFIDTSFSPHAKGGVTKRCFDCRYPGIDASGEVIKGKGTGAVKAGETRLLKVRQGASAGRTESAIFDSAINIDHLVS